MKKIVWLLVAFLIFASPVLCYAGSVENLKAIDLLPSGFTEENMDKPVTRAEFSYMTAKLINSGDILPTNTRFADVTEENLYSGYIEYLAGVGVLSGTHGATFNPDAPADINMVNKILTYALGYGSLAESLGGYPDGVNIIANELGLHKNLIISDGYVTKAGASNIVENALLGEIPDMQIINMNGKLSVYPDSKATKRILCDVLGYSAFTGTLTKVNYEENTAVFTVRGNKYSQNKTVLSVGSEYVFDAGEGINFAEYEQMPVTIWVNDAEEVINIIPDKNAQVKYGYIEKVNGNDKADANYPAVNIEDIIIAGDEEEYEVSESLTVKYNGEITNLPVKLCGRFARLVMINDEIIYIESWDAAEGGLITNIDFEISYIHGEKQGYKIKDILTKKSLRVFIDNEVANYKDIRANSVFDYYETDETLVLIVSEEVYSEKLKSYSPYTSVQVGNLSLKADGKIYASTDGVLFKENANVDKLLGETVYVYFAPSGYAKYIVNAENVPSIDSFYGVVSGVRSDIFGETADVELYKVKGTSIEKGIYNVDFDKIKSGITADELKNNAKSISKNCLYKFTVNANNKILSIQKPEIFYGLKENAEYTIPGWVSDSSAYFAMDGVRVYLDSQAPITYVYSDEEGFKVSSITWNTIKGKNATGAKLSFYGEEKTAYPEFVFMSGGTMGIYKSTSLYGIYTGYTEGLNAKGEPCKMARIITNSGAKEYCLDDETIRLMEEETGGEGLVIVYTEHNFSNSGNEISYNSTVCRLSDKSALWETKDTVNADGLHEGTVDTIAGNRVYFDDGTAYYMTHESSYKSIASVNDNTPGERFKKIELKDIQPGDKVYYYLVSGSIYSIILA